MLLMFLKTKKSNLVKMNIILIIIKYNFIKKSKKFRKSLFYLLLSFDIYFDSHFVIFISLTKLC
jgi:hypothetical protein